MKHELFFNESTKEDYSLIQDPQTRPKQYIANWLGTTLLYSPWDEVSKNLVRDLENKEVKNPLNINLVSIFEFPDYFGAHNEIGVPVLITRSYDSTKRKYNVKVEDYPPRIWDHLGLC